MVTDVIKVGGVKKTQVLWQVVFLPASPLAISSYTAKTLFCVPTLPPAIQTTFCDTCILYLYPFLSQCGWIKLFSEPMCSQQYFNWEKLTLLCCHNFPLIYKPSVLVCCTVESPKLVRIWFDWGREMTFGSSYWEVQKIGGSPLHVSLNTTFNAYAYTKNCFRVCDMKLSSLYNSWFNNPQGCCCREVWLRYRFNFCKVFLIFNI